jgi:hypothetical protein
MLPETPILHSYKPVDSNPKTSQYNCSHQYNTVSLFGEDAYPYQGIIAVSDISEVANYQSYFLKKAQSLMKNRIGSAHRDDKAHYEGLLIKIGNLLNK